MKIALGISYQGKAYHGFQKQRCGLPTVAQSLEEAISVVADESVEVVCAGRTDRGVHALGQVVHFETNAIRSEPSWILGTNSHLPSDIAVQWAREMPGDFHARFSALSREYRYIIYNHSYRPGLFPTQMTWHYPPLDISLMQEGSQYLLGEYDFSSFRGLDCQAKSPIRTVESLSLTQEGRYIYLDIKANAFLHHMVRNIAGSLMIVGEGRESPEWIKKVLEAKDRCAAGITAPAEGLYFVTVAYPDEYNLPLLRETNFVVRCAPRTTRESEEI